MKNHTPLNRRELPIQIKDDREQACEAVVPVHPGVIELPECIRMDEDIAKAALESARKKFEDDSLAYANALVKQMGQEKRNELGLPGYMTFDKNWRIAFFPYNGLMGLRWQLNGDGVYDIGFVPAVAISNAIVSKDGQNVSIEEIEMAPNVTLFYGLVIDDDYLMLPKGKMLQYEARSDLARMARRNFPIDSHIAVIAGALCSSYVENVPQALLLRNWGVEYANQLLSMTEPAHS
jgi:hypothetical protein